RIKEVMPLSTPAAAELHRVEGGPDSDASGTAIFDAVAFVLMASGNPDQRHIGIVLTDTAENASFLSGAMLTEAARRTSTALHVMVPDGRMAREAPALGSAHWNTLKAVAETTGGDLTVLEGATLSDRILAAIDAYRRSYVLQYRPAGVSHPGWHPVVVK